MQVVALNTYLNQPNPYAPGKAHWFDWFDHRAFGPAQQDTLGNYDWVPFNLFDLGLYYNKQAFAKAGVQAPIKTWEDWRVASKKLRAAGKNRLYVDGLNMIKRHQKPQQVAVLSAPSRSAA